MSVSLSLSSSWLWFSLTALLYSSLFPSLCVSVSVFFSLSVSVCLIWKSTSFCHLPGPTSFSVMHLSLVEWCCSHNQKTWLIFAGLRSTLLDAPCCGAWAQGWDEERSAHAWAWWRSGLGNGMDSGSHSVLPGALMGYPWGHLWRVLVRLGLKLTFPRRGKEERQAEAPLSTEDIPQLSAHPRLWGLYLEKGRRFGHSAVFNLWAQSLCSSGLGGARGAKFMRIIHCPWIVEFLFSTYPIWNVPWIGVVHNSNNSKAAICWMFTMYQALC